MATQIKCKQM